MIDKIKEKLNTLITSAEQEVNSSPDGPRVVIVDAPEAEPELRVIGLFSDVTEEKTAELVHALLYLNASNKQLEEPEPIDFYLSTYGGSADDMFALYDVMRQIMKDVDGNGGRSI
jgi:ATP-dependent protease ClpP protease subunit